MRNHNFCDSALHGAVQTICGLLNVEVSERKTFFSGAELNLRYELVACLLGSQVRAESATMALNRLVDSGLLSDARWESKDAVFEEDVIVVLENRVGNGKKGSYRFPRLRARQLCQIRAVLQKKSLLCRVSEKIEIMKIRADLVRDLPGIGPKQASMFLRNIGASYDVAILDTHVLKFFQEIGLFQDQKVGVATLKCYEGAEGIAKKYAEGCGHQVGYLDWAIWITMRAVKELRS